MTASHGMKIAAGHVMALALILATTLPTSAQVGRGDLVLTGSASPNPASAGGRSPTR